MVELKIPNLRARGSNPLGDAIFSLADNCFATSSAGAA